MLGRHHVWAGLPSLRFSLQPLFLHWALFLWGQSRSVPFSHCKGISPAGDKDSTVWGCPSPQGSPSALWGVASVAALHLLGHISSSCAIDCGYKSYKRQLKIKLWICVPGASEVKTWEYMFDLVLLSNLNLFHLLTLLIYYHKDDYNLQRYTMIWIWVYRNDMVCLWIQWTLAVIGSPNLSTVMLWKGY